MPVMMSTKMTKGGQTTVPKEIRTALGIDDQARVYWTFDGTRAYISAEPAAPLAVTSEEDFRAGLAAAERSMAAGRVREASAISDELRTRYDLV